ncbi:MAG TPA: DUF1343 domain-containing protein, partial [Phycisphaerales bacterium]|nr:DUF1343 domain-containing protein [Phycisphaerales bacterium]
ETAAIYPGLCLLEGTNISEARGTKMPFRQFGAPWIDSKVLAGRLNALNLPAMRFEPVSFTPANSKYRGRECHGVRILVADRDRLEPYFSGVRIVNEIRRLYPDQLEWRASHFDRLCGTSKVRNAITSNSSLDALKSSWRKKLETFLKIRAGYLIYTD